MFLSRTTKQRRPLAKTIGLNEDVVTEIFLHLPVKSVIRFKCLSKRWLSLFSNPQFCRNHTLRNPNPQVSTLFCYGTFSKVLELVSLDRNGATIPSLAFINNAFTGTTKILQSCNGLLLCSLSNHSVVRYYICNPTTRQYTMLLHPGTKENMIIVGINLAFDPLKWDQYKAVCIWKSNLPDDDDEPPPVTYLIDVYSPSSESWRAASDFFSAPCFTMFDHGVYWNGAIHWLSPNNEALYFDVERESLKMMALPPYDRVYSTERFQYFGVCHCHLHLIENLIHNTSSPRFSVLEMAKDYSGWVVKYYVHLIDLGSQFPDIVHGSNQLTYYTYKVLSVVRGEKEEDLSLVLSLPGRIISYNPKDKSSRVLLDLPGEIHDPHDAFGYRWYNNYLYTEMLSCF